MATYKLKDDIIWGVLPDTNGKPNIIFKKGDIIKGDEKEIYIYNQWMKGVSSKPTVVGARVETADGLAFSPLTNLEKIADVNSSPTTDVVPQNFLQKHKNHLLIALALVAGYFAYKKFKN